MIGSVAWNMLGNEIGMVVQPLAGTPPIRIALEWWSNRSSSAVATTGLPKMSPHAAKPRFEVVIIEPFPYRVPCIDRLEEQIAAAGCGQVADFTICKIQHNSTISRVSAEVRPKPASSSN